MNAIAVAHRAAIQYEPPRPAPFQPGSWSELWIDARQVLPLARSLRPESPSGSRCLMVM
jgi:hypothetical protein